MFGDTKGVIRGRQPKIDRQYILASRKKDKSTKTLHR